MTENTLEGLRIVQAGIEGVKAQGTLTMDTQPTAGDTVTVGAIVYTWRAIVDTDAAGEISIGADLAAAKLNFVAAINGLDAFNTQPNPYASAAAFIANVCTLTARIPGPAGNSIATTETFTAGTNVFNAATLGTTTSGSMARGTAVPATTRLAVEQLDWGDDDENIYIPQVQNGMLIANSAPGVAVQHGTRFSLPEQAAIWEQLPLWLGMAIEGVPTLTGPAGGPHVHTFTRDPTVNPNPLAVTLQRRYDNGLGDEIDERAPYAMLSELGFAFAVNEHLRISGAGFARKFESSPITGGLTLPDFEVGVSALSAIYVDSSWANVGNTLLAEQVIGWNLRIGTGIFPRHTAEARTALDYTKHQINGREVTLRLEVTCLLDPTTYAAEQTAANGRDLRAVQVRVIGSDSRVLEIDMLMQHEKPGLWAPGVDQGQDTVTYTFVGSTDNTNFLRAILTLPDTFALA